MLQMTIEAMRPDASRSMEAYECQAETKPVSLAQAATAHVAAWNGGFQFNPVRL
jgi:hypothetical protein